MGKPLYAIGDRVDNTRFRETQTVQWRGRSEGHWWYQCGGPGPAEGHETWREDDLKPAK